MQFCLFGRASSHGSGRDCLAAALGGLTLWLPPESVVYPASALSEDSNFSEPYRPGSAVRLQLLDYPESTLDWIRGGRKELRRRALGARWTERVRNDKRRQVASSGGCDLRDVFYGGISYRNGGVE